MVCTAGLITSRRGNKQGSEKGGIGEGRAYGLTQYKKPKSIEPVVLLFFGLVVMM